MKDHFIICGLGRIGVRVLAYLQAAGNSIVVVDMRGPEEELAGDKLTFIQGDFRQENILKQAGVTEAKGILILSSDDLTNLSATLLVHHLNPQLRMVVRMFNQGLIPRLGPAAKNVTALSTSALAAPVLAMLARTGDALGEFTIPPERRLQIAEILIRAQSPLRGHTLRKMIDQHEVLLTGHQPRGQAYLFVHDVDVRAELASGDRIVICGEPATIRHLRARGEKPREPELLWAGTLRRIGRVFYHTWMEIDWPLKICALVLIGIVVMSTLIFHLTMQNDSLPDAFYRTISLMATMADLGLKDLQPEGWQKIFVSVLRLTGAALIAAFTAILTNYLVRAQLKGALEVRRIPEAGHIVVCGLGNVGFRVVESLRNDGEQVVVLERSAENQFVAAARRKKAAVIVADATVAEVLKEAHVESAKAVVVTTEDELVNLEIGLLVREINPAQRVILRLTDAQLAQTLRDDADLRLALSIPDLAAPAFIAALFGDRVHCVFFISGHLLVVIDLVVESEESILLNEAVRSLSSEYRLQVVSTIKADGGPVEQGLDYRLELGDCLTAIVDLVDLQKLLHRSKAQHS